MSAKDYTYLELIKSIIKDPNLAYKISVQRFISDKLSGNLKMKLLTLVVQLCMAQQRKESSCLETELSPMDNVMCQLMGKILRLFE